MSVFEAYERHSNTIFWSLIAVYVSIPVITYIFLPYLVGKNVYLGKKRTITIYVLGDLGHLPRITNHARSFAESDYYVNLVGYEESQIPDQIIEDINIDVYPIKPIANTAKLPFIVFGPLKVIRQCFQLWELLMQFVGTDFILIQNPPSIPILVLTIVFVKALSRDTKIVIDWHNLNYLILNLRYQNENHPFVRALRWYERVFGRMAHHHIAVSQRMASFLVKEFGISKKRVTVLHDRPAEHLVPLSDGQRNEVLHTHSLFADVPDIDAYDIVVSSTLFTPDEDFNVLLDALALYDAKPHKPLIVVVTGKGPLKQAFLHRVSELAYENIVVKTAWLSAEEYPTVLGVGDVGVSLHTSSSGIDLPMKIVDFFGVGVPVITLDFPAISELVEHGGDGLITQSNQAAEIHRLLTQFLGDPILRHSLKQGALTQSRRRWKAAWTSTMGPKFSYEARPTTNF